MFNINTHIYKHFGRDRDTVNDFFKQWSPNGLKCVTVESSALDDENFFMLTNYLRRINQIDQLTIASEEKEQPMDERSQKNLMSMLTAIKCKHLRIEGVAFKIDSTFLKELKNRIHELTVTSESFEWKAHLISQLPSHLSGLTICAPDVSWIGLEDKLPSDLKRLYIRSSPSKSISDVEASRLFRKIPHVQFDFSLLSAFTPPEPDVSTAVKRLDLFFDRDARPILEPIFSNLPKSLRQFSISYTGHAHNALEGWWRSISEDTVNSLEALEFIEFDDYALADTIEMFQSICFPSLTRLLLVCVAFTVRNCEDRLRAVLPDSCSLIVKKSETQI